MAVLWWPLGCSNTADRWFPVHSWVCGASGYKSTSSLTQVSATSQQWLQRRPQRQMNLGGGLEPTRVAQAQEGGSCLCQPRNYQRELSKNSQALASGLLYFNRLERNLLSCQLVATAPHRSMGGDTELELLEAEGPLQLGVDYASELPPGTALPWGS